MIENYDFYDAHLLLIKLYQQHAIEVPVLTHRGNHE
jgi:hypothetical protein